MPRGVVHQTRGARDVSPLLSEFERAVAGFDRSAFEPRRLSAAAAAWARRASFEHASIAAFDRFALGLLAVGAPPELLEGAHVAAVEEIRHSRIGYALASLYGGEPLGPGPLDVSGALEGLGTLEELAVPALVEGLRRRDALCHRGRGEPPPRDGAGREARAPHHRG